MTDKNFWRGRSVLVTGCTGVLGSWLTAQLVELGADVVGLIRDSIPNSQLVRSGTINKIKVVHGSITDDYVVNRIFPEYEIQTCFHLAALTVVGVANRAPVPAFEANIRGTWTMLEAARQWGKVEEFLFASSDKAYGSHEVLPYTEDAPLQGKHPYDVSKSCADLIVRSDGTMKRDYLYVKDAVNAYLTLAEALHKNPDTHRGQAYNFGLDKPLTVLEMVNSILQISDHPELKPVILNQATNEIQNQYLSSTKAHQLLNWQPHYTLEAALQETMGWYADVVIGK
ncbi:MAG: GDP-mannose 4,6-dehydratase [Chloroflexi bacterium]|nr:GDP-mannose 4,6-dehydratase [Chloroflexota bacterium]